MFLVTAYFRAHGVSVLCSGTTGIASLNHTIGDLTYGFTSHGLFGIPVIDGYDTLSVNQIASALSSASQRYELIKYTDVFFWDEVRVCVCVRACSINVISCMRA